jgi:hypothetical protein
METPQRKRKKPFDYTQHPRPHPLGAAERRQLAKHQLEAEILRGITSGDARPMTKRDWQRLHIKLTKRMARD